MSSRNPIYLIVNVGDVHDVEDIILKVVLEDTADNVKGEVITGMANMGCIVDGGTTAVPAKSLATGLRYKRDLAPGKRVVDVELGN